MSQHEAGDSTTQFRSVAAGPLGIVVDQHPAAEAVAADRRMDWLLHLLERGGDWQELPGSAVEASKLKQLFGDASTVLLRSNASEEALGRLAAEGRLQQFRYLHFATHGEAVADRSFDSALILTREGSTGAFETADVVDSDGRVTARDVLETWKLNADLVTLSSCESALGPAGGGDGLLGFAQALLMAGSRSVCLSLWKVDDSATALLMFRFYQNLLGKRETFAEPMPKAAALAEAKKWLRELTVEESARYIAELNKGIDRGKNAPALKVVHPKSVNPASQYDRPYSHPRYWAAFVLIGDPN